MLVGIVAVERLGLFLSLENSEAEFHRATAIAKGDIRPIGLPHHIRFGQPFNVAHSIAFNSRQATSIGSLAFLASRALAISLNASGRWE